MLPSRARRAALSPATVGAGAAAGVVAVLASQLLGPVLFFDEASGAARRACHRYTTSASMTVLAIWQAGGTADADNVFTQAVADAVTAGGQDTRYRDLASAFTALAEQRGSDLAGADLMHTDLMDTGLGRAQQRVDAMCHRIRHDASSTR